MELVQQNFKIYAYQDERLDQHKAKTGVPKAHVIRLAIDEYFERLETEATQEGK
jgi:predicted DNA-binding protein